MCAARFCLVGGEVVVAWAFLACGMTMLFERRRVACQSRGFGWE